MRMEIETMKTGKILLATAILIGLWASARPVQAADSATAPPKGMMELKLDLPRPVFSGTPKNAPPGTNIEPPRKGPRPPLFVPEGTVNVARGKKVISSDMEPIIGELALITDGDKATVDGSFVELGPGLQWVQIDLEKPCEIYAVALWHFHQDPRVFRGVVVQTADDPDFIENVKTHFNNDSTNETGLGIGQDKQYYETFEGKLIPVKDTTARYVRLYSKGNTADAQNQYIEVEVFGKPK